MQYIWAGSVASTTYLMKHAWIRRTCGICLLCFRKSFFLHFKLRLCHIEGSYEASSEGEVIDRLNIPKVKKYKRMSSRENVEVARCVADAVKAAESFAFLSDK